MALMASLYCSSGASPACYFFALHGAAQIRLILYRTLHHRPHFALHAAAPHNARLPTGSPATTPNRLNYDRAVTVQPTRRLYHGNKGGQNGSSNALRESLNVDLYSKIARSAIFPRTKQPTQKDDNTTYLER